MGNQYKYDSGHTNYDIKFAATKFHGAGETQAIVVHIVAGDLVFDSASLMCQLMVNAIGHYAASAPTPAAAPATPHLPPKVRLQVDGVGTNWGLVTLAFICFLVMIGIVDAFEMARNPVGTSFLFGLT